MTQKALTNACLAFALACPALVRAADLVETPQSDFSDVTASPTPWTLALGANSLVGNAGKPTPQSAIDYDLVAITIPAGLQLDSIDIADYQNIDDFALAFFALEAGPAWTDGLGFAINGTAMMGWAHVDHSMRGADLLVEIHSHASEPPFAIPLPSGVYTLLIQDLDTAFDYNLRFNVSAVPEPMSAALLVTGLAAVALRRIRRR